MLAALALLVASAHAGDRDLYRRTLDLVEGRYLWTDRVDHAAMVRSAGRALERRIDWLLIDEVDGRLRLHTAARRGWQVDVREDGDPVAALEALEDGVRAAGLPVDEEVDVRVEILRGVVDTLDRHTVVLHARGLERFDERLSGTLSGIGVTLSSESGALTVTQLFSDGPAAQAGLQTGDVLVRIDGVSTVGMTPADASGRIRGAAGTEVALTIGRGDARFDRSVVRAELSIPNVTAEAGPDGLGVVRIDHFSEQTVAWLQKGLDRLADLGELRNGVAVDLRGNTGGSLAQSARAADAFLQTGRIVTTIGRDGQRVAGLQHHIDARADYPAYTMPVVVLMDEDTASGSEILAGSLARLDRALLLGETSFGKGTVQTIYPLEDGLKLKLTVAEWALAGDRRVDRTGLTPDIEIRRWSLDDDGVRAPTLTPGAVDVWEDDDALRLAAAITGAAHGGDRPALLEAARRVVPEFAAAQSRALIARLASVGIDWTDGRTVGTPDVRVELAERADPGGSVAATVTNAGPTLWRGVVRVRRTVDPADDVVFVVGHLESGRSTRVVGAVGVPRATEREEEGEVWLEAAGVAPTLLGTAHFVNGAPASPPLAADVHLAGDGADARLVVDVQNRGDVAMEDVRVRLDFPATPGVALDTHDVALGTLAAHRTARATLGLDVADDVKDPALPFTVEVRGRGAGSTTRWDAEVPRDGAVRHLEAPTIALREPALVSRDASVRLSLAASDDASLDHVVVWVGREQVDHARRVPSVGWDERKVAWLPGVGRRAQGEVDVPLSPGSNRIVVVAEDRAGLRTTRTAYVRRESDAPAAADSDATE